MCDGGDVDDGRDARVVRSGESGASRRRVSAAGPRKLIWAVCPTPSSVCASGMKLVPALLTRMSARGAREDTVAANARTLAFESRLSGGPTVTRSGGQPTEVRISPRDTAARGDVAHAEHHGRASARRRPRRWPFQGRSGARHERHLAGEVYRANLGLGNDARGDSTAGGCHVRRERPASAEGRSRSTVGSRVPMDLDITAERLCVALRVYHQQTLVVASARLPRSRRGVATRRHRDSRILSRRHVPPRVGVDRPLQHLPSSRSHPSTPIRLVSSLLPPPLLIRASPPSPSVRHDPRTRAGGPRDPSPIRPARDARPSSSPRSSPRARRRPRRVRRPVPGGVELGHHGVARHRRARRPGRLRAISRGAALRPRRATAHRAQLRATPRRRRRDHRRRSFPPRRRRRRSERRRRRRRRRRLSRPFRRADLRRRRHRRRTPFEPAHMRPGREFEVLYGDERVRVFRSSGGVAVQVPSDWTPSSDEDA